MRIARSALALLVVGLALAGGGVAAVAADDPIVGVWTFSSGMEVTIAGSGGSLTGTVTKAATASSSCPHPAGELMWKISGAGGSYTGSHYGFSSVSTCEHEWQDASWTVVDGNLNFFDPSVCGSSPCGTLTRVTPPVSTGGVTDAPAEYRAGQTSAFSVDAKAEPVNRRGRRGLYPDYVTSTLAGSGRFTLGGPDESNDRIYLGTASGSVVLTFLNLVHEDEVTVFEVTRGSWYWEIRGRKERIAQLWLRIRSSTVPGCKPGDEGRIQLWDGGGQTADRVAVQVLEGRCKIDQLYVQNDAKQNSVVALVRKRR